jgi:hypothetical protein
MNKKKIAAILSAVDQYVEAEKEEALSVIIPTPATIWGTDGRRQIMSMRNLWQLRIFKKEP